ncbi:putative ABC transport system ATP-binding protein [Leucobacter komagatae]|uniref:Putative ABC transport system ATP-binding protein n=1 Tax=Leucobacter komagatae TaxID=55969 RepID=A0A542XXV9_9MICO|nr:ABC transporter ATP-binding protein [Leucobacter komagatae]TQL40670.1 putative ABC transport system ATP-binding protein [Leucobacter komagatae]
MNPVLSVRGIERSFGMDVALRGVDLDVAQGEILAIMGPSGSGKSTLLHILAGVLTPDSGTASYRDPSTSETAELSALGEAARAKLRLSEFGFVFQFGQLLPDLSAVDNVSLPLLLAGQARKVALRQARRWLERLGLADHAEKLPSELSGGQAQRVAIARALVTAPKVIFADEPTGALDSLSAEQVMLTLTELSRASGTTVVLVTHDARTAAYADREIVVRDGKLSGLSR